MCAELEELGCKEDEEKKNINGEVRVKVITPVEGYNHVWEKVVEKFILNNELANLLIEVNYNNATPFVVSMRLKQCLNESEEGEYE
ncbi:MAG: hypothetical protein ACK5LT_11545 [Lachnospirales bacterium]